MNIRFHQRAQCLVDEPVTFNAAATGKFVSNNRYIKMSATVPGSSVPGVQVALVFYQQVVRRKLLLQDRLNRCRSVATQGSTLLNGFTVTFR